jgi:hypothetical protein
MTGRKPSLVGNPVRGLIRRESAGQLYGSTVGMSGMNMGEMGKGMDMGSDGRFRSTEMHIAHVY